MGKEDLPPTANPNRRLNEADQDLCGKARVLPVVRLIIDRQPAEKVVAPETVDLTDVRNPQTLSHVMANLLNRAVRQQLVDRIKGTGPDHLRNR